MRHLLLLLTTILIAPSALRANEPVREMMADSELVDELREMVTRASALDLCKGELAAFVVRRSDGKLVLVAWPTGCTTLENKYRGIVPPTAVAIVHTHPDNRKEPSAGDIAEAYRIKLPICVLTRRGVWLADPTLRRSVVILDDPRWMLIDRRAVR